MIEMNVRLPNVVCCGLKGRRVEEYEDHILLGWILTSFATYAYYCRFYAKRGLSLGLLGSIAEAWMEMSVTQ